MKILKKILLKPFCNFNWHPKTLLDATILWNNQPFLPMTEPGYVCQHCGAKFKENGKKKGAKSFA